MYDGNGQLLFVVNRSMSERYLNNFVQMIHNERKNYEHRYDNILRFVQQQSSVPIIASSPAMQEVLRMAQDVARSDASVLLTGEPGVGKEVVARFICQNSARASAPFIPVNCSAIPKELVESEFFGYENGAFTGAQKGGRAGLFELADSITEIKTICDCGRKATTNARISPEGYVVTEGDQVFLGGNDSYIAMCHKCYQDYILQHRKVELLHGSERDLT